jgi:hypothetical protein
MKIISTTLFVILLLFSCKKKEEKKDSCLNGYKDIGETNIDCGGVCKPCPTVYIPSVQCLYNGSPMSFHTKALAFGSSIYSLSFFNDSIYVQINLGGSGIVGPNSILQNGTMIVKSNTTTNYTHSYISGVEGYISSHDMSKHRMSGLFQMNFFTPGSGADTVRITNGSFEDMLY